MSTGEKTFVISEDGLYVISYDRGPILLGDRIVADGKRGFFSDILHVNQKIAFPKAEHIKIIKAATLAVIFRLGDEPEWY